ncbi:MAG: IclR family transcriptional regulator [Rhodoplanes sp.]|uniref:IclR family transcriptional regulator n=1 Tax=Rhodoplanes sp. TaxID=1968906 RepID=UPI00181D6B85|nr:IclR family transcriptional regulator [Rhodoplanes sp.]NVO13377.1 IclR family transcriptional regulator [Rhodoplanes sp.]
MTNETAPPSQTGIVTGQRRERATATDNDDVAVQSVGTSFRILDELAAAGRPLRLTEIANALHETKAKVHRHLTTLRQIGAVEQDGGTERYRLGWKLVQLGESVAEQFNLREIAAPYLTAIRDETRETALLAVPVGWETQVISVADNIYARVFISIKPGNRPLPHAAAQGRVVLAFSSPDVVERALVRDLFRLTPHTIVDRAVLRERFAAIRERLWDTADCEIIEGVNTLAVPILRDGNELAGVFSIVGLSSKIPGVPDPHQLEVLHRHARLLSESLNGMAYRKLLPGADNEPQRRRGRPRESGQP